MEYPYFDLYSRMPSKISFMAWTDTRSIDLHRHSGYELMFVVSGSCRHIYKNVETLLIPGDVALISEHQEHGFSLASNGRIGLYNCQFTIDSIEPPLAAFLESGDSFFENLQLSGRAVPASFQNSPDVMNDYCRDDIYNASSYEINSSKQGIIHLSPVEFAFIKPLFENGLEAQGSSEQLDAIMQKKILELILIYLKKAQSRQNRKYTIHSKANQQVIASVLVYIENHLDEQLDFKVIAEQCSFSINHFRTIFKDVTGFSPVSYVNRLRIIRACEYMQKDKLSMREAAELVGIYDINYFSRLFRKIMGFAPSKL